MTAHQQAGQGGVGDGGARTRKGMVQDLSAIAGAALAGTGGALLTRAAEPAQAALANFPPLTISAGAVTDEGTYQYSTV